MADEIKSIRRQHDDRPNQTLRIPLTTTTSAFLQVPFPVTRAEWEQLERVLAAMKPALTLLDDPIAREEPTNG